MSRYRKRDVTSIAFDGYNVRQSALVEIFGDKDIFLSILNPLYFINVLGESGKGLLEKILPTVSDEDVLAALNDSSREVLAKQHLLSPETFIKNRRSDLKELEEALIGYRSQKELLDCQRKERFEQLKELQNAVNLVEAELTDLVKLRNIGFNQAVEGLALTELRTHRTKLLSDMAQASVDKIVQSVQGEIRAVETSITKLESKDYASRYAHQIIELETNLKALYEDHAKISKALNNTVVGYKCPVCATLITIDNVDLVKADLLQRLSVLVVEGKKSKMELDEIRVRDEVERGVFENQKTESLATYYNQLDLLSKKLGEIYISSELDTEDYKERLADLDAKIIEQERRIANGSLTTEQAGRANELAKLKQEYQAKMNVLKAISDYDFTSLIEKTESEVLKLKRLISEALQYMAKRVELMLKDLKMNTTEIVLSEIVKSSGEIKDCFRFSYEGRDYRCLSLSEKVRAGLEVSILVQRLSGRKYPIFIDNSESICSFGGVQPASQVILSRVVKNQELQIICKDRGQQNMVA